MEKCEGNGAWLVAEVRACLQIILWPCFRQISTWYSESWNLSINPESVIFHHVHRETALGEVGTLNRVPTLGSHLPFFSQRPPCAILSQPGPPCTLPFSTLSAAFSHFSCHPSSQVLAAFFLMGNTMSSGARQLGFKSWDHYLLARLPGQVAPPPSDFVFFSAKWR